ncbi:purine-nucleoside phosphorylase [Polaribacter undariae]|uniref:Uridine phosphorylase n=1 Tax=Polaribacter sejongensis TaxID=985043 RepID=A0AAJ1VHW3_9FLAO|nr:purine-nucleoside phosphorylase [Polaribacter undariae]MDN3621101.1 purine-nucleoside phosphorylase [Polaribacter undariae]UWD33739.1 purine-nucleoside phosphorylase [Polaribacter undariae]
MSVHIEAKKGEIAETVLLPGDPMRAKWIADTFLKDVKQYNDVRGMLGFTGTYNGKKVSVQGTGMGIPSTLIYCTELITEYGVKNLIRVGSAGSYQEDVKIRDIVLAMSASTNSGLNTIRFNGADYAPTASFKLFQKAIEVAKEKNITVNAGGILSSDEFYADEFDSYKKWADYGVLCVEMETAGLYTVAAKHNVNALSILTISDSLVTNERTTAEEREQTFKEMIEIALELA